MRKTVILAVLFGALLAAGLVGFADYRNAASVTQQADSFKVMEQAREYFQTGNMEKAEKLYREAAIRQETNGEAWFMYGLCRHYRKDYTAARGAFQKSVELNYMTGIAQYNIACGYAKEGKNDAAIKALKNALDAGFAREVYLDSDPDLKNLRSDPRFREMVERTNTTVEDATSSAMKAWLGEWDIYNEKGQWAGTAQYVEAMNGYAIEINYSNYSGAMSQGLLTYDQEKNIWSELNVNEKGRIIRREGKLVNGKMVFTGDFRDPANKVSYAERMTWENTADGKLKVMFEKSEDAGKSWTKFKTLSYTKHISD